MSLFSLLACCQEFKQSIFFLAEVLSLRWLVEYGALIKDLVGKHIKLCFVKVCDIQIELSYNSFI